MGVEGKNLQTVDVMSQHDVVPIIGKRWSGAEIHDGPVGGGTDRIGRFAPGVALEAPDVESFVHLPAIRAYATEGAGCPRFAHCADKKPLPASRFKQGVIGGR